MRMYLVQYAFIGQLGTTVHQSAMLIDMLTGNETEALARVKQKLNGSWKRYGPDTEVIILSIKKQ